MPKLNGSIKAAKCEFILQGGVTEAIIDFNTRTMSLKFEQYFVFPKTLSEVIIKNIDEVFNVSDFSDFLITDGGYSIALGGQSFSIDELSKSLNFPIPPREISDPAKKTLSHKEIQEKQEKKDDSLSPFIYCICCIVIISIGVAILSAIFEK